MTKYDRLLFILNLLRTRKNMNAALIARECGVTERTIYRDIIAISEANIPIYYDRGYKYATDNFLPPLNFTVDEYLTLSAILESSPLAITGSGKGKIKMVKTKIEAVLSQAVRRERMYSKNPTEIKIRSTTRSEAREKYFAPIEEAIRDNLVLSIEYESIESGVGKRLVEPLFMIFIERAFYFVAYCRKRKELRTFRLDRLHGVKITEETFVPRKELDPEEYFKDSWGVYAGEPVEVEIKFSGKAARVIRSGNHHPNESVTILKNGDVKYSVTVSGTEEIMRWIIGFGDEAVVVKPKELIERIKKHTRSIIDVYNNKGNE